MYIYEYSTPPQISERIPFLFRALHSSGSLTRHERPHLRQPGPFAEEDVPPLSGLGRVKGVPAKRNVRNSIKSLYRILEKYFCIV